jgi:uncharacterized protein (DUF1330 family)
MLRFTGRLGEKLLPEIPVGSRISVDATMRRRLEFCGFSFEEKFMAKGYWVTFYRSVSNPAALSEYAKLAGPAIQAAGGRFISRGTAVKSYEEGVKERSVMIEFDSVEKAVAAYESAGYQAALKVLQGSVERDVRILEGV